MGMHGSKGFGLGFRVGGFYKEYIRFGILSPR